MVTVIVWIVLIGVVLICLAGTIFLWYIRFTYLMFLPIIYIICRIQYSIDKDIIDQDSITQRRTQSYLAFAIVATIVTIIICLVIFILRKRIQLVIELFKEAGKALTNMPLLLLEPILVKNIVYSKFFLQMT